MSTPSAHLQQLQQQSAQLQRQIRTQRQQIRQHEEEAIQLTSAVAAGNAPSPAMGLPPTLSLSRPLPQEQSSWLSAVLAPNPAGSPVASPVPIHAMHTHMAATSRSPPAAAAASSSPSSPAYHRTRKATGTPISHPRQQEQHEESSTDSTPNSPLMPFPAQLVQRQAPARSRAASSRVPPAAAAAAPGSSAASVPADAQPPLPCVWCRRKHRNCDFATPSCQWCQKLELRCSYPLNTGIKRGPAVGVVSQLKGQVASLQDQLRTVREQNQKQQELMGNLAPVHHRAVQSFLSHLHTPRDQAALHAYFFSVNNSLFPFLDRAQFILQHSAFSVDPSVQPPLAWTMQYSCAVAIGATINGEHAHAKAAISVARIISCALFDAPSYDAVRAFLMLSYYLLGQNQHRRAACCLAIAKRQLFLVPMFHSGSIVKPHAQGGENLPEPLTHPEHVRLHEQLKLLLLFLEDMLQSSAWWRTGWSGIDELAGAAESSWDRGVLSGPSAAMLPSLFPSNALAPANADAINLYSSGLEWPDLLLNPHELLFNPSMEQDLSLQQPLVNAAQPKEFAFNETSPTACRGGNVGLFDFSPSEKMHLFEGALPMAAVELVDRKAEVLAEYAAKKQAAEAAQHSSGGSSTHTRTTNSRKRKVASQQPDSDAVHSDSPNSPHSAAQLYKPLSAPAASSSAGTSVNDVSTASGLRSGSGVDLQISIMRCMATLSSIRGDVHRFKEDPSAPLVLHQCISVLSDGEHRLQQQQMTLNSPVLMCIRALVTCMKALSLQMLSLIGAGGPEIHARVMQAAKQATTLTATVDLSFCPFLAAFYHPIAQLHLAHAQSILASASSASSSLPSAAAAYSSAAAASAFKYVLLNLRYHERVASRWDFARPIFGNLQQRVWSLVRGSALPSPLDPTLMQLLSLSLPQTMQSGASSNQIAGSLASADGDSTSPFVNVAQLDFSIARIGRGMSDERNQRMMVAGPMPPADWGGESSGSFQLLTSNAAVSRAAAAEPVFVPRKKQQLHHVNVNATALSQTNASNEPPPTHLTAFPPIPRGSLTSDPTAAASRDLRFPSTSPPPSVVSQGLVDSRLRVQWSPPNLPSDSPPPNALRPSGTADPSLAAAAAVSSPEFALRRWPPAVGAEGMEASLMSSGLPVSDERRGSEAGLGPLLLDRSLSGLLPSPSPTAVQHASDMFLSQDAF